MAIPINEDPYLISGKNFQFWSSKDNLLFDAELVYHRPKSLQFICARTKFTKREIQLIYRSFKQVCPTGSVSLVQFQKIFSEFFPQGNSRRYADLVFRTFDHDENSRISFEEFVTGFSIITRGSHEEKFNWIFTLYDINKCNSIGLSELTIVTQSIYELLAKSLLNNCRQTICRSHVYDHVFVVFNRLCQDGQTQINRQQFIEICQNNKEICDSIALFGNIL